MRRRPTAVELTGKRWKALQILGHTLAWPGIVAYILTADRPDPLPAAVAAAAVASGLLILVYAHFMAWWHHG